MVGLGNENGHAFHLGGVEQLPVQLEVTFQSFQVLAHFFDVVGVCFKNCTEEESFDVLGGMLLQVHNVCASLGEDLSGTGNKALLVRAMNLQNVTCNSHVEKTRKNYVMATTEFEKVTKKIL